MDLVTLDEIRAAADRVAPVVVRTPLLESVAHPGLWLKPENLQPTGAFKLRGATNAVLALSPSERERGVVTDSSGNHGLALAYTARRLGIPCVVVMPDVAPPFKIDAVRSLGAEIVLVPPPDRLSRTLAIASERGLAVVPPFDHPDIIAGQATIGLEILADLPSVAAVLVPVGGGGLASGVASAVTLVNPAVRVIGVEPELAGDAAESLRSGQLTRWSTDQTYRTTADGLRTALSELTFAHLRERLADIITVTEAEITSAVVELARTARLVVEPSGAVATAAFLHHRSALGVAPDAPVVAVVSGGNLAPAALAALLAA
jgi:threonine dehydratase